jgi:hypothetical protein
MTSPVLTRISRDPNEGRHAEVCHPIENVASNSRLGPLIGQNPGMESPANDRFVAKHRGLNQASSIVTRTTLPPYTSMPSDRCNMKVALGLGRSTCNCCHSWRNDNRGVRMTFGDCIVHGLTIIRAIRCH